MKKTFEIYVNFFDGDSINDPVLLIKRSSDLLPVDQSKDDFTKIKLAQEKELTIIRHVADKLGFTVNYHMGTYCEQCMNNEDHDHDDPILLVSEYTLKSKS